MLPARLYLPAFIALCAFYLFIPLSIIWHKERILTEGIVYRFRLQPIDPIDAFRGRYLDLNLNTPAFPRPDTNLTDGQNIFLALAKDSSGLAFFESLHREPPTGRDYLKARASYIVEEEVYPLLPDEMTRYYVNEQIAPLADKWYLELLNRTEREEVPVTLDLRVRKGKALVEAVYFEGEPVEDYIRKKEQEQ